MLLVLWALLSTPFIFFEHAPFVDTPAHIARHFIVSLPTGGSEALEFYGSEVQIAPNSAVDLLLWLVGYSGDPVAAARVIHTIYVLNFLAAALTLHRALLGRWSVWPLLVALIAYNGPLRWGFENYLFTLPFTIHACALWLFAERWPPWARIAVFAVIAPVIYIMHPVMFCLLAAFAAGRVAQQLTLARFDGVLRALPLATPFLPPIAHMALAFGFEDKAFAGDTYYGGLWSRLQALGQIVEGGPGAIEGPGPEIALAMLAVALATPLILFVLRLERPTVARAALGPLVTLLLVAALAPQALVGLLLAARMSVVVAVVALASLDWSKVRDGVKSAVLLVAAAFLATRIVVYNAEFAAHQRDVAELRGLMEMIPRGSRILPVQNDAQSVYANQWHVAAMSVVDRGNFVPSLFQGTHWLTVREPYIDSAKPVFAVPILRHLIEDVGRIDKKHWYMNQNGVLYIEGWTGKFTHVFFLEHPTPEMVAQLPLRLVGQGERYALYEIERSR